MNIFRMSFCLIFLGMICTEAEAQNHNCKILVSNIKSKNGKLMIGWYNSEKSYDERENPAYKKIVDVGSQSKISVTFENIPPGTYAVSMLLDENENKKMDTNFMGIPKEQYGFSNNVLPLTRAANFKEASFEITDKSNEISIRLK